MKNTSKKGFTLVELVIVIAVIAVLAAVLIPTFTSVITTAKQSAKLQEIKAAVDAEYIDFVAEKKSVPVSVSVDSNGYVKFLDTAATSGQYTLANGNIPLYTNGYYIYLVWDTTTNGYSVVGYKTALTENVLTKVA